ncbi:MAG: hypothetical protein Q7J57_06245 [Gemmobacter sp.]|nr:hypothetical protein [Gemmobacter sp.]
MSSLQPDLGPEPTRKPGHSQGRQSAAKAQAKPAQVRTTPTLFLGEQRKPRTNAKVRACDAHLSRAFNQMETSDA